VPPAEITRSANAIRRLRVDRPLGHDEARDAGQLRPLRRDAREHDRLDAARGGRLAQELEHPREHVVLRSG